MTKTEKERERLATRKYSQPDRDANRQTSSEAGRLIDKWIQTD